MSRDLLQIETDHIAPDARCACGICGWAGTFSQTSDVVDGVLTPGDPSPCGRCPKCESFCYLTRPEDALQDAAEALLAAVLLTIDDADDTGCDGCFVISADTMAALLKARDAAQKYDEFQATAGGVPS